MRSQEIEKYRYWDNEELSEIKTDNHKGFLNKLPLDKMNSFHDCLVTLSDKELIAIFTSDDNDTYYVGKIENLSDSKVILKLLSESSEWLDEKEIEIDNITYIGFDTSYEKGLIKNVLQQ